LLFEPLEKRFNKPSGRQWTHDFRTNNAELLTKRRKRRGNTRISGVNISLDNPDVLACDFEGKTFLAVFANDRQKLTLYFFDEPEAAKETLREKYLAGELTLTTDTEPLAEAEPELATA
jgi:predicted ATPase